jgi:hypothetical protein
MRVASACVLAACSTGGVSLHAQREWLPSHEVDNDDLSALRFTVYSPDPTVFEGYRQYPPGGYVAGGVDGTVEIADVPDGPYTLQVAYADHSDWYGYDGHSPTWFNVTAGRRGQVTAPPGTIIDLTGVTLGEAWTMNAAMAAACANTNSALDNIDLVPFTEIGATSLGAFDWGAGGGTLIDGSAGDTLVVLHRTEIVLPTDVGVFPGTAATEMFAPPPFAQTPGATTTLTGSLTPIVATTSAEIIPALGDETNFWTVDVSAGPGTGDGVPGAVLVEFIGAADPGPIPMVVADPFDPSWPLLVRTQTMLAGNNAVVVAIGDTDASTATFSNVLEVNGEQLGNAISWGGAKSLAISVDAELAGFELDLASGSATIHVYSDSASVMLPREALLQNVLYTPTTIIGSGAVTTHQQWVDFDLSPF